MEGSVVHSLLETCSRSWWASYHQWTFMAYCSFYCLCDPPSVRPDTHVINYYRTCLHVRGFCFYILLFCYQYYFSFYSSLHKFLIDFPEEIGGRGFYTHPHTCVDTHMCARVRARAHTHARTHFLKVCGLYFYPVLVNV
jgi:hypothetical protein